MRRATYDRMKKEIEAIVADIQILSGDTVGPSGATWQDVAGTLAVNLRALAGIVDEWRKGNAEPFCSFPGLDDIGIETIDN